MFLYLYPAGRYRPRDIVIYDVAGTARCFGVEENRTRTGRERYHRRPPITGERELLKKSPRTRAVLFEENLHAAITCS